MTDPRLRLAELIASLSFATDLALDQPMEHALETTLVACRLGGALRLSDSALRGAASPSWTGRAEAQAEVEA